MRIGFSSLVCPDWDLATIVTKAAEYQFDGVELRGLKGELYLPGIPDLAGNPGATRRLFYSNGVALGAELRYYSKAGEYRGLFGEVGSAALVTAKKFDQNTATVNYIVEFGVGYAFKSGWHVVLKFRHLSNLFLASMNSGADAVGVGFGYRF